MAKSGLNHALTELRGTIDRWTYRMTPEGELSVYTIKPSKEPPSESQKSKRLRFGNAQHYAKKILADPLQRAVYEKLAKERKRPTNTLLVANYLNPPTIEIVELAGYTGEAGQEIGVVAFDAIAVASVKVQICGGDGAVLESGNAAEKQGVWRYRTTTTVPAGTAWRVNITATNRADHAAIASLPDPRNPVSTTPGAGPTFTTRPPKIDGASDNAP